MLKRALIFFVNMSIFSVFVFHSFFKKVVFNII